MEHYKSVVKPVNELDYYTCDTCDLLIVPYHPRMIQVYVYPRWPEMEAEYKHFCGPICLHTFIEEADDRCYDQMRINSTDLLRLINELQDIHREPE